MTQQTERNIGSIDINSLLNESSQLYTNISQNVVITTEDKLEICLRDHQDILNAKSQWKTPIGMSATLISVLITADFKDIIGVSADSWKALFIFSSILTIIWSILTVTRAIKLKNAGDIQKIISAIKKSGVEH